MNINLGGDNATLFRQREGTEAHVIASKDFDFITGSEAEMLAGRYHIETVCGATYRYTKSSIYWITGGQVRNVCEACFYD